MAVVIVPPGASDISAYGADGDTIKFVEGSQQITTGYSRPTHSYAGVHLGQKCQVWNDASVPFRCDIDVAARSALVDARAGGRDFHFYPGGGDSLMKVVKGLGSARRIAMGGGRINAWEQRAGTGVVKADVRVDAISLEGGSFTQELNSNRNTDLRLRDCSYVSQRGFSGTCDVLSGSTATFKLANSNPGSPQAGATLRVAGGKVDWLLGDITTLILLDGEFSLEDAPFDLAITTLYISSRMKRSDKVRLRSRYATVTLPSTIGTDLFVLGDESDDLLL